MGEPESLPRQLGGFTLLRVLGRGAFGVVYEARNNTADRTVALKLLRDCRPDDEAWQRFHKEAHAAARLAHPHCVFVYAVHLVDGVPAIEMELATGGTLQQRLDSGEPVSIAQALTWAAQLLDGVEAAHRAGVLHRDLKPSNCFLTSDGQVKVGDFGLSHLLRGDPHLTRSGAFLGTLLFAPPEQVRGEPLDARADVYSAAATLHNLLASVPPFLARTYEECIGKVLTEEPPALAALRPDVPKALSAVVQRALSKDRRRRPATCAELAELLDRFRPGRAEPAGVGVRLVAWSFDVLAVVLLWEVVGGWLLGLQLDETSPLASVVSHGLAAAYHFLAAAWCSASLGQLLVGVQVRAAGGGQAGLGALAVRVLSYPILPMLAYESVYWSCAACGLDLQSSPWSLDLPLTLLFAAAPALSLRRGQPFVGWHERWSRTRTVVRAGVHPRLAFEPIASPFVLSQPGPQPEPPLVAKGLLAATADGWLQLGYDPQLGRDVWLHWPSPTAIPSKAAAGDDATGLRLVAAGGNATAYDVYENPGGAALHAYAAHERGMPWDLARRALLDLARHFERAPGDALFDRIWIDANSRLRVLPFRAAMASPAAAPSDEEARVAPEHVLAQTLRVLMGGSRYDAKRIPAMVPLHADRVIAAINQPRTPQPLAAVRALLEAVQDRPTTIGQASRLRQLVLALAFPCLLLLLVRPWQGPTSAECLASLELRARAIQADLPPGAHGVTFRIHDRLTPLFGRAESDAVLVVLARICAREGAPVAWTDDEDVQRLAEEATQRFPSPTSVAHAVALQQLVPFEPLIDRVMQGERAQRWLIVLQALCLVAAASVVSAACLHNQPSWAIAGAGLRGRNGQRASRMRTAWRTFVCWLPWLLVAAIALAWHEAMMRDWHSPGPPRWYPGGGGILVLLVKAAPKIALCATAIGVAFRNQVRGVAAAFWRRRGAVDSPDGAGAGLADLLAGTRLVAR